MIAYLLAVALFCSDPDQFSQILENRHSGTAFDSSRIVPYEYSVKLAAAASLAPSSYNEQPWQFIFCDKDKHPESYYKALDSLVSSNKKWAESAPLLIIGISKDNLEKSGNANPWSAYDLGAAVAFLSLKATSLGLMTHQMAGFEAKKVQEEFQIPSGFQPRIIIAVGYEKPNHFSRRVRKPLEQFFHFGEWKK